MVLIAMNDGDLDVSVNTNISIFNVDFMSTSSIKSTYTTLC